jgi:uncharacterized membrane protein required for colicin V production
MLQIIDIVFIAIFIVYILRGLITGLVSASISILSKAAALFLAIGATPYITFLRPFWAFWGIIALFLLLTGLFRVVILKKTDEKISILDRFLGGVIGALDALFVGGLISYFMLAYPHADLVNLIEESSIGNFFASYIYQARSVVNL